MEHSHIACMHTHYIFVLKPIISALLFHNVCFNPTTTGKLVMCCTCFSFFKSSSTYFFCVPMYIISKNNFYLNRFFLCILNEIILFPSKALNEKGRLNDMFIFVVIKIIIINCVMIRKGLLNLRAARITFNRI